MKHIKKNKFCIITTQRSGSAWLISLLESHPEIKAFYEIFLDSWAGDEHLSSFQNYDKRNFGLRPEITWRYLHQLETYPGSHNTIGFKIMYNQLGRHPELLLKFIQDDYKIIHLVRENHLDLAISSASMRQNGLIHTTKKVKTKAIALEPKKLMKDLKKTELYLGFMRGLLNVLPLTNLEITYDQLVRENEQTLLAVAGFLGVATTGYQPKSDRQKVNKGTYREKIINYEEIENLLTDTKYAKFLNQ